MRINRSVRGILLVLGLLLFSYPLGSLDTVVAASDTWPFETPAHYSYDSDRVEVSGGMARLNVDGWMDSNWGRRLKITVQADSVPAAVTEFPVYVDLSTLPATFFDNVDAVGADIRVTRADGTTKVPREVVALDATSDTGELYFKAPSLSATSDTYFYLYYDNPSATAPAEDSTYGAQNVWTNGYEGVWHLEETSGDTAFDATANNHDATRKVGNNWIDAAWDHRKKITINSDSVPADLTDFPVLIELRGDGDLAAKAQPDGDDILFTDASADSQIPHEIETFDGGSGDLVAWVKVPRVSAASDTHIYLYYGNPAAASQEDTAAVWDPDFGGVWHLGKTSGQSVDVTANNNHGSSHRGIDPWYDTNWDHRKRIVTNKDVVSDTLSDFPVLVKRTDSDFSRAQSDGDDFLFVGPDETPLDHEIEHFDGGSGELVAWVRLPELPASSDTYFYVYYDNPAAANRENPSGVWNSNYRGVWHLEESPGSSLATIQRDDTSSATVSSSSELSFSHTIGSGSNRLLVVGVTAAHTSTGIDVNDVTYNGVSLTKAADTEVTLSGNEGDVELWYLLDIDLPSSGSYTVKVTASESVTDISAGAVSVTGAAQQSPEATTTNTASDTQISTTITTTTDGAWVMDAIGSITDATNYTPDPGQTEQWDKSANMSGSAGSTEEKGTAGSETQGWTSDDGGDVTTEMAHVLAAFAPATTTTSIKDSTSNGNDGTTNGSMDGSDQASARINGGLDFDGSDDFIDFPMPLANPGDSWTMETWFRLDTRADPVEVIHFDDTNSDSERIGIQVDEVSCAPPPGCSNWYMKIWSNGHTPGNDGQSVSTDTWYHASLEWDGSKFTLYRDGQFDYDVTPDTDDWVANLNQFRLANSENSPDANLLDGLMDEARVSNVARSDSWIATQYNNVNNPSNFLGFSTQQDSGVTGPIRGVDGQVQLAHEFDGTNERHVRVPDDPGLRAGSNLTVSAWVRTTQSDGDVEIVTTKWRGGGNKNYLLGKLNSSDLTFRVDADAEVVNTSLSAVNDGNWHRLTGVADAADGLIRFYVDGTQQNTASYDGTTETGDSNLHIGNSSDVPDIYGQEWEGRIDEVRVSGVARSDSWIQTGFNNQSDTRNFLSVGTETDSFPLALPEQSVDGKILRSYRFDTSTERVENGENFPSGASGDSITGVAWIRPDTIGHSSNRQALMSVDQEWGLNLESELVMRIWGANFRGNTSLSADRWQHVGFVWDAGSDVSLYLDGQPDGSTSETNTSSNTGNNFAFGAQDEEPVRPYHGRMDEIRVSRVERSDSWIEAQFDNQNDPPGFYAVGEEETEAEIFPDTAPSITADSPSLTFRELASFSDTAGASHEGALRYQISPDGSSWYYHDGGSWSTAADTTDTSTAAQIDANAASFDDAAGTGTFHFKAFLVSDGSQQVELDTVALSFRRPVVGDLSGTATVSGVDTGVHLFWHYPADDNSFFRIYRVKNTTDTTGAVAIDTAPLQADTITYTDSTAVQGDSHYYYVTAVDTAGNESDSSPAATAAHLTVSKSDNGDSPHRPGDTIVYTVTYTNDGFGPASRVMVVDAVPASTALADSAAVLSGPGADKIEYDVGGSWQSSFDPSATRVRWIINGLIDPQASGNTGQLEFKAGVD